MKIELGAITEVRLRELKNKQPGCYKLIKGAWSQICYE